jgi:3-oxoacyl-[acyl-carrier-protein] synthase II
MKCVPVNSISQTMPAIAITGTGLVTALGLTPAETWQNVLALNSHPAPMPAMESPLPPGSDGFQAPDLPPIYHPNLPREARYLRWTIESALKSAGCFNVSCAPPLFAVDLQEAIPSPSGKSKESGVFLKTPDPFIERDPSPFPYDPHRRATILGTTLHGMRAAGRFIRSRDYTHLRDFLAGDTLRMATTGLGLSGQSLTTCSACSSSLGSIALAVTLLQTNQADLVVTGGYDTISEYVWAGFNALRLITPGPLRPFTKGRQGMKLGEGYAILILERADDAIRRKAPITAFVAGWGESADAHHLTQPDPQGQGAQKAMTSAITRADITPQEVDLIAAHATGTPDNDAAEYAALTESFGEKIPPVPVVCFKSHLGHTLGAAGAAELILSTQALATGFVPPTANADPSQLEFPIDLQFEKPKEKPIRHTLNTSLGFGGANTCVVLSSPESRGDLSPPSNPPREVWITGIGVVMPTAVGRDAFIARLQNPTPPVWQKPLPPLIDTDFENLLNTRRVRRMSFYVKTMLAAATLACRDAVLSDPADLSQTGALLGTTHGPSAFSYNYYSEIVRDGVLAANPVLFAEGVPNVGAAHLSLMLGLRGGCQTLIGSRTAGLDAFRLAWLRIASGESDRIIVGAAEEPQEIVYAAYDHCGLRNPGPSGPAFQSTAGFNTTAGAVSLILESADSARARRRNGYAVIDDAAAFTGTPEALPRTIQHLLQSIPQESAVMTSGNATWIDKVELRALEKNVPHAKLGGIYDAFGETFSATPLLGLAATLFTGKIPTTPNLPSNQGAPSLNAGRAIDQFTVLCTDWQGPAASATFTRQV